MRKITSVAEMGLVIGAALSVTVSLTRSMVRRISPAFCNMYVYTHKFTHMVLEGPTSIRCIQPFMYSFYHMGDYFFKD